MCYIVPTAQTLQLYCGNITLLRMLPQYNCNDLCCMGIHCCAGNYNIDVTVGVCWFLFDIQQTSVNALYLSSALFQKYNAYTPKLFINKNKQSFAEKKDVEYQKTIS